MKRYRCEGFLSLRMREIPAMYDSSLGRFIQRDPLGPSLLQANSYAYSLDQPNKLLDPTGALSVQAWPFLSDKQINQRLDELRQMKANEIPLTELEALIDLIAIRGPSGKQGLAALSDPVWRAETFLASDGIRRIACCILQQKLRRAPQTTGKPYDETRVAQLLQDLESSEFGVRQAADAELRTFGIGAIPFLENHRTESLEAEKRLEKVMESIRGRVVFQQSERNALEVLLRGKICGPETVNSILEDLAQGGAEFEKTWIARRELLSRLTRAWFPGLQEFLSYFYGPVSVG
jgi:RHS repeat-associated protein